MNRNPLSHKGQNGVVAVIGGSRHMHGAPIFSALAAEASGVDLIHPCVPECHLEVTKNASNNFIITPFRGCDLAKADVSALEDILAQSTTAVIGPGLATFETAQKAMEQLIRDSAVPLVLDASALEPWTLDTLSGKTAAAPRTDPELVEGSGAWVVTPHIGELSRMQGQVLEGKTQEERKDIACTIANTRGITMLLKGPVDIVAGTGNACEEVKGGNAGLTKGGTGDALAGLIAGLIAQGMPPFDACVMAATVIKRAATVLYHEKGYAFTTMDVIAQIPHLVHTYE